MDRALGEGPRGGGGRRRGRGQGYNGGGGHHGGGGGGGRGYGGTKRPREEPDPDGSKALLNKIFHLGNRGQGRDMPLDVELDDMTTYLLREPSMLGLAIKLIIDCAVEITDKTPHYAVLCGLLNSEDQSCGARLVDAAHSEFVKAMEKGDMHRSRMLLRFFASLVVCNVILPSSLLSLLLDVVSAARSSAEAGAGGDGRLWQPWADHLVYSALISLPWAGSELAEGLDDDMDALLVAVGGYMSMRPKEHSAALMPFRGGGPDDEDRCKRCDSGGASFLGHLWAATQELKANGWIVESVPQIHEPHESRLAQGHPHALPGRSLPTSPPCITEGMGDITAASTVAATHRPRGIIRLLPEGVEGSGDDHPSIERVIVEEYILDTLHWFDGDRRETVMRLGNLPVPFKYEAILIETLFGQLLCLPMPPRKPVGYLTIMVDCMKTIEKFSKPLSGCVRELFARMELLDPELQIRLAEWLAYHLSCFGFQWPWERWSHVLDKPLSDNQRRFCVAVLSRVLRLSYHDKLLQSVPESFVPIVPPNPLPQSLDTPMVEQPGEAPPHGPGKEEERCQEMLGMVRGKVPPAGISQWIEQNGLEEELSGPVGVLGMVVRTLLVAGSKSFTHTLIILERYSELLHELLSKGGEEAEDRMVAVAAQVWINSPQRAAIAIDRLMGMRFVQGSTIIRWVFASRGMKSVDDELAKGLAWEALVNCTNKMIARAGDEREDIGLLQAELDKAREAAEKAEQAVGEATMMEGSAVESRLSMLQERQSMANKKLQELEGHKAAKLAAIEEADNLRDATLINVYAAFVEMLDNQLRAEDSEGLARDAWVEAALGSLRVFTRSYHVDVAPVAARLLEEVLAEGAVHPLLRSIVTETLQI